MEKQNPAPSRQLVLVGRKSGARPFVMDPPLSPAGVEAHRLASHVRPAAKAVA